MLVRERLEQTTAPEKLELVECAFHIHGQGIVICKAAKFGVVDLDDLRIIHVKQARTVHSPSQVELTIAVPLAERLHLVARDQQLNLIRHRPLDCDDARPCPLFDEPVGRRASAHVVAKEPCSLPSLAVNRAGFVGGSNS